VTLTFSDRGFTSTSADTPADTAYDPRIDGKVSVQRDAYGSRRWAAWCESRAR
jgi:hypothetical protein